MTGSPEPQQSNKQKFPRLIFLSAFFGELCKHSLLYIMKNFAEEMIYETPNVEVVEVEVEKGFAGSSGFNPDGTGRDPVEG